MVALSSNIAPNNLSHAETTDGAVEYRLFWRFRASGPWRREEFVSRDEAFNRYFYLLGRGLELRWGNA